MPSKNNRFFSFSSVSSMSSSSQLTTPREFQNSVSPQAITLSPLWDLDKARYSNGCSMPKSNEELRREITELETEIVQLERYILSLYRTSFGDLLPELFPDDSFSCRKLKPFIAKFSKDRERFQDTETKSESGNPSLADLLGLKTPIKLSEEY